MNVPADQFDVLREKFRNLPESARSEIVDFAEFLEKKHEASDDSTVTWSDFSLQTAMRGMEDEESPEYTSDDVQEAF